MKPPSLMHKDERNEGAGRYADYRERPMADPEFRQIYEEEAVKVELRRQ